MYAGASNDGSTHTKNRVWDWANECAKLGETKFAQNAKKEGGNKMNRTSLCELNSGQKHEPESHPRTWKLRRIGKDYNPKKDLAAMLLAASRKEENGGGAIAHVRGGRGRSRGVGSEL